MQRDILAYSDLIINQYKYSFGCELKCFITTPDTLIFCNLLNHKSYGLKMSENQDILKTCNLLNKYLSLSDTKLIEIVNNNIHFSKEEKKELSNEIDIAEEELTI